MIVSTAMVVLPVDRSPMISSRWPRPIGIIASIGHDAGLHRLADRAPLDDAGRDLLDRIGDGALRSGPLPSSGSPSVLTTRPSSPLPTGTCSSLPVARTSAPSCELRVVAEDDDADFGLLEVERQAGDAVAEVEHLVEHDVVEALDLGDAVADLADHPDGLPGRRGPGFRDLASISLTRSAMVIASTVPRATSVNRWRRGVRARCRRRRRCRPGCASRRSDRGFVSNEVARPDP